MTFLTKSKYLAGLQCLRFLWYADRKQMPEPSEFDKQRMMSGYAFQEYVEKLFPDAVILGDEGFKENLEKTKEAIKERKTIFEAGIKHEDLYIRADILIPNGNDYDLIEIKASTKAKPEHIPDLAFQKHVLELERITIKNSFVFHLNKEYIRQGEINPEQLLTKEDVTTKVNGYEITEIETFQNILQQENPPKLCDKPKGCNCPKEDMSILYIKKYKPYYDKGILELKDVEDSLEGKDKIVKHAILNNTTYTSKEHIKHFLGSLNYPLYHFDFETIDSAIPMFNNSRPWQKIPFQYSLHIENKDKLTHHEYLGKEGDPRKALLEQLKNEIGTKGDIIVYHAPFEKLVFKELKRDFPEYEELINNILSRIVDLAIPFKQGYYYNPEQKGSYSLKKVLPAITGKGYQDLEINNGGDASVTYYLSHIKHDIPITDKLREDLLAYCKLDTEGMVWIVDELGKL